MNLVPPRYRSVSVTGVDVPLDEGSVRTHLLGRPAYRRTRHIVVRAGERAALVEVEKRSPEPLFSEITAVRWLAGPEETVFVRSPGTDTGVPTQLARVASERAPEARCVVVEGRYGHVNLILDPAPVRVRVVEVVPPYPAKLVDQASRVLDLAEDLPPVALVPELTDLADLARERPSAHYLLPCRGGGVRVDGAEVAYLDQVPERAEWTLVGCARSRAIHGWFYGEDVPSVDMCPRRLAAHLHRGAEGPVLTKCCLLEDRIEVDDAVVAVPWGASLDEVRAGVAAAVEAAPYGSAARVP